MATDVLTLSRYKLMTFLTCQRRFQLRYLAELPWPSAPQDGKWQTAIGQGEAFHQLAERHFLGLPLAIADEQLRGWWDVFERFVDSLPAGKRLPELSLTVPIGSHLLTGRYDLLILGEDGNVYIFDWKTEARPRSEAELLTDWQTTLYLAMLAESGGAFGRQISPEQIKLTYWFANAPADSVIIPYSEAMHRSNWQKMLTVVDKIDGNLLAEDEWPLTDNRETCGRCAYAVYCGRVGVPAGEPLDWQEEPLPPQLEPSY